MENCFVVIDTNAYRDLAKKNQEESIDSMKRILELERKNNIKAMLSPIVLLELFSHLSNKNDENYNNCKNAIIISYEHCRTEDNFRLFLDFEIQSCITLFRIKPLDLEQEQRYLYGLAYDINNNPDENHIEQRRDVYKYINDKVQSMENRFRCDIWNYVIKTLDKVATSWKPNFDTKEERDEILRLIKSDNFLKFLATSQVSKSVDICFGEKRKLSEIEIINMSDEILNKYPAPFYLYREILYRIIQNGVNFENTKKNRVNWWWDMQILFCIGAGKVNDEDVYLITSDTDMVKAAEEAGYRNKIKTLDEYISILKS